MAQDASEGLIVPLFHGLEFEILLEQGVQIWNAQIAHDLDCGLASIRCVDYSCDCGTVGLKRDSLFRTVGATNEDELVVAVDAVVYDFLNHIDHKIGVVPPCSLKFFSELSASNLFRSL